MAPTKLKARALGGAGPSEIVFADWLDGSELNLSRPDNQDWQPIGAVAVRITMRLATIQAAGASS